jgi:hypothetical protein
MPLDRRCRELWLLSETRRTVAAMRFPSSESESREGQAPTLRDGTSKVGRLVRVVARMLLWGCVLLLLVRGIDSEFRSPQIVKTPLHQAASGAGTTEGE